MKKTLIAAFTMYVAFFTGIVDAREHSTGLSYKPAKLYSCAGCNKSDHYVEPTTRSNGEYVQGHMQTNSNSTRSDNFTQKGNINPYTGKLGDKD